jgi:hypothetical protein
MKNLIDKVFAMVNFIFCNFVKRLLSGQFAEWLEMKRYKLLFLLVLTQPAIVCAQDKIIPVTISPVFFDISPPLRNLVLKPLAKADQSWKENVIPNEIRNSGYFGNLRNAGSDTVLQNQNGLHFPDTILRSFDGLGNVNNIVPPDTHGDVGPSHYFQLVNLSFAIYDKTGAKLLGPLNTSSVWEGLPHNSNNGDGIVLYDEQADRWLISQFSFPAFPSGPFYQMIAVSQTPDPTGSWYRWEFEFGDLPDYPKFGVWPDGYYMSYTRMKSQTLQVDGVGVAVFDRNGMLNGIPAPLSIQFNVPSSESPVSLLPADCDGTFPPSGTPNYFGYFRNGFFVLRELHADWINPSASTFGNPLNLPISPFSYCSLGIPQKGSDKMLTPLDDRLMYRLQYRKFNDHQCLVVNHTVCVGSRAGVRWYELRKTNGDWFVNQQSTYSPDSLSRWMGSIAMDSAGNIALGYSVSGQFIYPSIRFTGRMKHDPPGQMTIQETTIIDGTGSQTGIWNGQSRWGDYSTMTVDPSALSTFWYAQEYYATTSNNSWKTRIASFSFANILDIHSTASPQSVCMGGSTTLDATVAGGNGTYNYLWRSVPAGFTSNLKSPVISPVAQTTFIVEVTSGVQVKTDSVLVDVIPSPTVFAGNDTVICRYHAEFSLTGAVTNSSTVSWFTSGDGYFSQPNELNTQYYFGFLDKISDSLTFKLAAYPSVPCLPVSATRMVILDTCAGINDLSGNSVTLHLRPNPVRDLLTIDLQGVREDKVLLVISNLLDKTVFAETIEHSGNRITRQIDVSGFAKGMYFVRVQNKSGCKFSPFVVQ